MVILESDTKLVLSIAAVWWNYKWRSQPTKLFLAIFLFACRKSTDDQCSGHGFKSQGVWLCSEFESAFTQFAWSLSSFHDLATLSLIKPTDICRAKLTKALTKHKHRCWERDYISLILRLWKVLKHLLRPTHKASFAYHMEKRGEVELS